MHKRVKLLPFARLLRSLAWIYAAAFLVKEVMDASFGRIAPMVTLGPTLVKEMPWLISSAVVKPFIEVLGAVILFAALHAGAAALTAFDALAERLEATYAVVQRSASSGTRPEP